MLPRVGPPETTPTNAAETRPPRHRPLSALTFVLMVAALALTAVSAAPALARELGWTQVRTVSRGSGRGAPHGNIGVEAVKERERSLQLDGLDDDDDSADTPHTKSRIGITLHETKVYRDPGEGVAGTLDGGEKILVVREDHGYFMIIRQTSDGAEVGWVKRTDVIVR